MQLMGTGEGAISLAGSAERQQAEYYRALLEDQLARADGEITAQHVRLKALKRSGEPAFRIREVRSIIREKRSEQRELQSLHEALNERFFSERDA
jgi:hypothetical protein